MSQFFLMVLNENFGTSKDISFNSFLIYFCKMLCRSKRNLYLIINRLKTLFPGCCVNNLWGFKNF